MDTSNVQQSILVVDDEPNILIALEFLLQKAGFKVNKANSGIQALAALENDELPNLIILDVMMPEISGFDVAKKLRANERFSDLKIVFLTAKGTERDKMTGYSTGADYYIVKPFDNELLISTVKEILAYG